MQLASKVEVAGSSGPTPATHAPARHVTLSGYLQLSRVLPSQAPPHALPSVMHEVRPPCGESPFGTALHLPMLPDESHDSHWPRQALSQHTPSVQKPLKQAEAEEQALPGAAFGVHAPAAQ
jgi:hypothetical protein